MRKKVFKNTEIHVPRKDDLMVDIAKQKKQQEYQKYVKQVTPTHNLFLDMCKAFVTGGAICVVGQFILNWCERIGMKEETASGWCALWLVLFSVILTGLNVYQKLAKFGGAGTLVPITGFANAIAAPAVEFKTEGFILGVGAKLFTIAGPVIVYGLSASVVYGFLYWLWTLFV